MKTQITRYLGTLAIAAALLTTSTSAFAATPASTNPALYDSQTAVEAGSDVASGLDVGGAGVGVGAAVVDIAGGNTEAGQITAGSLAVGSTVLTGVAAPIVVLGAR